MLYSYEIMIPIVEDENGNIIHIDDVDKDNNDKEYICLACGTSVKARSLGTDNKMQPHFYHLNASECRNESIYHKMYKKYLFKEGKDFILVWDGVNTKYSVKEIFIEKEHKTKFGIYKPDVTVITNCGKTIFFEMNYSSKKYEEEYFDKWSELNNDVVEIDVKKLYRLSYTENTPEFDIVYHDGVCNHKYEKHSRTSTYYKTIGNYKRENKFTPEKIQQIEKLDWFWAELKNYKKGLTEGEKVVELFSYLDIEERDICVEIVKKLKCIDLQDRFKKILYDNFVCHINVFINNIFPDNVYKYKIELKQVSSQLYEITFISQDLNKNMNEAYHHWRYNDSYKSTMLRCYNGYFLKYVYDNLKNKDFLYNIKRRIRYYNEKVYKHKADVEKWIVLRSKLRENIHNEVALLNYDSMSESQFKNMCDNYSLNTKIISYEGFYLYSTGDVNIKYIYDIIERENSELLIPGNLSYIKKDYANYKTNLLKDYFRQYYTADTFYKKEIYNDAITSFINSNDLFMCEKDSINKIKHIAESKIHEYKVKKRRDELHLEGKAKSIIDILNSNNFIKYSFDYNNYSNYVFHYYHIDLDYNLFIKIRTQHQISLTEKEFVELSEDSIVNLIISEVNNYYKSVLERDYPEGYEITIYNGGKSIE